MYKRRVTQDGVTVMNKELYDNLQDGIDELKNSQFRSFCELSAIKNWKQYTKQNN